MITKQAIEKAIEGGWQSDIADVALFFLKRVDEETIRWQSIALDPTFWQALGRSLGWEEKVSSGLDFEGRTLLMEQWRNEALHFYDLILTGGDTEAFWKDLLA